MHARWVLDLLPSRECVVEKLVAALRPGGWLLDEEPDLVPTAGGSWQAYRTLVEAGTVGAAVCRCGFGMGANAAACWLPLDWLMSGRR